jgi:hypothetical protein
MTHHLILRASVLVRAFTPTVPGKESCSDVSWSACPERPCCLAVGGGNTVSIEGTGGWTDAVVWSPWADMGCYKAGPLGFCLTEIRLAPQLMTRTPT